MESIEEDFSRLGQVCPNEDLYEVIVSGLASSNIDLFGRLVVCRKNLSQWMMYYIASSFGVALLRNTVQSLG